MASYDKLVKYLADKFQAAVSPLTQIVQNQEIIIAQNKQIINLLGRTHHSNLIETESPSEVKEEEIPKG